MENQPYSQQSFSSGQQQALPNAVAVLVLGIISIPGCSCYGIVGLICSIIALVLAKKDFQLYNANPGAYSQGSYSNLKAGRVCAIVGLSLSCLYLLACIIVLLTVGLAALRDPAHFLQNMH